MSAAPDNLPVSSDLIALAARLADASGAAVSRYFRSSFGIDSKKDASPVTIADREAEQAIRALLKTERPQDGIHGEEFGSNPGTSGYVWVLDPIDGTKAFATGRPLFGTLIGLLYDGKPVLGVIDQPINKERWIGAQGRGTTLNGAPVRVRACPDIAAAVLATTGPDMFDFEDYIRFYSFLQAETLFTIYGGDCYSYGQLSCGWLDGIVEAHMKLHDYAALIPVVEGAGGIITTWQGAPLRTDLDYEAEEVIACGDRALHEKLCAILSA